MMRNNNVEFYVYEKDTLSCLYFVIKIPVDSKNLPFLQPKGRFLLSFKVAAQADTMLVLRFERVLTWRVRSDDDDLRSSHWFLLGVLASVTHSMRMCRGKDFARTVAATIRDI